MLSDDLKFALRSGLLGTPVDGWLSKRRERVWNLAVGILAVTIGGVWFLWIRDVGISGIAWVTLGVAVVGLGGSVTLMLAVLSLELKARRQLEVVKNTLSRFVSKDVSERLLSDPSTAELGGRRSTVTVLFSDLRGFTSMSEDRPPEEIVSQLNQYFSAMVEVVFQYRGTIDKFVGDMIMALFNTPLSDPHHADHAVQCAIAMHHRLGELNDAWQAEGKPPWRQGIGINTGEMVAGIIGAETIRSYTVIGDNVNLGARLESLCKEYQAGIIVSESTVSLLRQDYAMEELGEVLVKGKLKPVRIFRVFSEERGI